MVYLHISVMLEEVLEYLNLQEGGVYVDCTLGTGGHTLAILEKTKGKAKLIGIDWDEEAIKVASQRLKKYQERVTLVRENFSKVGEIVRQTGFQKVDGFLYDLGLSSLQLEDPKRVFSFKEKSPLDMRMDIRKEITAAYLVNNLSKRELEDILWNFGEERWARRIAEFIVQERKRYSISNTKELIDVLRRAIPAKIRRGKRIHFATKTFQALRIAVNQELENLEKSLEGAINLLSPGGRLCVISYHSLEDRIVKRKFKEVEGEELILLTSRVIKPSREEIKVNPRSHSARLRVAGKL